MVDLGIALVARGNVGEAERRFRQALDVRPDNVDALLNLATVLAYRGDRVGAERYLSEAVRVDPRNAKVRAQLQSLRSGR
jgi:Flp pilus assembly protein TadD